MKIGWETQSHRLDVEMGRWLEDPKLVGKSAVLDVPKQKHATFKESDTSINVIIVI